MSSGKKPESSLTTFNANSVNSVKVKAHGLSWRTGNTRKRLLTETGRLFSAASARFSHPSAVLQHPPPISFLFSGHVTEAKRGIICDLISHGQQRKCKRLPHAHSQGEGGKKEGLTDMEVSLTADPAFPQRSHTNNSGYQKWHSGTFLSPRGPWRPQAAVFKSRSASSETNGEASSHSVTPVLLSALQSYNVIQHVSLPMLLFFSLFLFFFFFFFFWWACMQHMAE